MNNQQASQSYLGHLRAEHNRLELLSRNIRDRFMGSRDDSWNRVDRPEIAARLGALQDELAKHIDRENAGGCLEEAVSRLPSLSPSAQKINQENDELKERLQQVMRIVDHGSRADAKSAFLAFATDLQRHERFEEKVVAQGLNAPFEE